MPQAELPHGRIDLALPLLVRGLPLHPLAPDVLHGQPDGSDEPPRARSCIQAPGMPVLVWGL
eukprot:13182318-Alexandrium_andersonii.AAC.1